MGSHKVVGHQEWLAARKKHLTMEKEFTRLRDQISRERRDLPWELVDKDYTLEGANGMQTPGGTFAGRGQLIVYHAMFNPDTAGPTTTWTRRTRPALAARSGWITSMASRSICSTATSP